MNKRTNPMELTDVIVGDEEYGVVISAVATLHNDTHINFVPYNKLTNTYGVINSSENDETDEKDKTEANENKHDKNGVHVNSIHDQFSLVPVDAEERYQVIALKPGYYVIDSIKLNSEWQAKGGIHQVSRKPMYGGFEIKGVELVYLGDLIVGTDRTAYKNSGNFSQQNALGLLISVVVQLASPSFTDDDVALGIADHTAEAQAYINKKLPNLKRKLIYRPLELGYYAGQNHGEGDDEKL